MPQGFDPEAIMRMYRQLMEQANQANLERFGELPEGGIMGVLDRSQQQVGDTYGEAGQLLEDLGATELEDIERDRQRATAMSGADLRSRGLSSTTRGQTEFANIGDQARRARERVLEDTSQRRAGLIERRGGAEERMGQFLAQMMEARTDQGPDLGMMADLLMRAGEGQGQTEGLQERTSIFRGTNQPTLSLSDSLRQGQPSGPTGASGTPTGQSSFGARAGKSGTGATGAGGQRTFGPGAEQRYTAAAGGGFNVPSPSTFRQVGQQAAQRLSAGPQQGAPGGGQVGIGTTFAGGTANVRAPMPFDFGDIMGGAQDLFGGAIEGLLAPARAAVPEPQMSGQGFFEGGAGDVREAVSQGNTLAGTRPSERDPDWWKKSAHGGLLAGMGAL